MTGNLDDNKQVASETNVLDDAVGMASRRWFVAVVRHNTEKKLQKYLSGHGLEAYVASQPKLRIYPSGRKKWVDMILIHSKVFIHCTEKERREIVVHPYIHRFLVNPTGKVVNGSRPVAVIPEKEMETLRFMLGQKEYPVSFSDRCYKTGAKIKIIRGSLKGLEGEVIESDSGQKDLLVHLDLLGSAKVSIPLSDLQPL